MSLLIGNSKWFVIGDNKVDIKAQIFFGDGDKRNAKHTTTNVIDFYEGSGNSKIEFALR